MLAELSIHLTAGATAAHDGVDQLSASASKALAHVSHLWCAVRGHDVLLHFEPERLSLQCTRCGWQSPGWTISRRSG